MLPFVPCVLQGVPFWNSEAYCCYCYCCYVVVVIVVVASCHRSYLPGTSPEPTANPPLRLQFSDYSTLRTMCDVPSSVVFCSESVECFLVMASKVFLKPFVRIPVTPVSTGIIIHFMFHIRCISIHKLLYFSFFSSNFCITYSVHANYHIYQYACFHFFIISGLFL